MRPPIVIAGALSFFAVAGSLLEGLGRFAPYRRVMRDPTVPARALDQGTLGRVLRDHDLVCLTGPRIGDGWRGDEDRAVYRPVSGETFPPRSDEGIAEYLTPGQPLLSIAIDPEDLHGPIRGIFTHWNYKLERPGHFSLFDGKEIVFGGYCGIRLHGGASRTPERRALHRASFRVYLREEYGPLEFPPGVPFDSGSRPIDRLVVRGSPPTISALAFDIARRLGSSAPTMQLARFVLNGDPQGCFALSEHLTRRRWTSRLGHSNFRFYRMRGSNSPEDHQAFWRLVEWARSLRVGEVTADVVGQRVDLARLLHHLFAIMWCGTDDWIQGAAVLDLEEPIPLWRWVHWDMDRSFLPSYRNAPTVHWEKPALGLLLGGASPTSEPGSVWRDRMQTNSPRVILFAGLLRDDPAFRERFSELAMSAMNHKITASFLDERMSYYRRFADLDGVGRGLLDSTEMFVKRRSEFVRRDLGESLGLGEALLCTVQGPDGGQLVVDGCEEGNAYRGWYFRGQEITVEIVGLDRSHHQGWQVNGARVSEDPRLTLEVRESTVIQAMVR